LRQFTNDSSVLRIIEHGHEIPLRVWSEAHHDSNKFIPEELHDWLLGRANSEAGTSERR
jgi:hypothetical protein